MTVAGLVLHPDHLANLEASGLLRRTIDFAGLYSARPEDIGSILGGGDARIRSLLAFPYPGVDPPFIRWKTFPPPADREYPKYFQKKGSRVHLYIPPTTKAILRDPTEQLYWVEGEKKCLRLCQEGFPAVGLGGLWNYRQTGEPLPELFDGIAHAERTECLVPDSNVWSRPELLRPVFELGTLLEDAGADIRVIRIPPAGDRMRGVDDFMQDEGVSAFQTLDYVTLKSRTFSDARKWFAKRKQEHKDARQGRPLFLEDPAPWPEPVDGAALLDEIEALLGRHFVLPQGAAVAVTLWSAMTYLVPALELMPMLAITSPTMRCGKTKLLGVTAALCCRALPTSSITPATLFRIIDLFCPTVLLDEADKVFRTNEELRGLYNAAYTRDAAWVPRCVGDDHAPRLFKLFAPRVLALIGRLPDTMEDRSIVIAMQRKGKLPKVERVPKAKIVKLLEPHRQKLARWAQDHIARFAEAEPQCPEALDDRARDNWEPLLRIADLAGGRWLGKAREAALVLSAARTEEELNIRLLVDLQALFAQKGVDRLATAEILDELHKVEDAPWSTYTKKEKPLTAYGLGKLLRGFGVTSGNIRLGDRVPKGYLLSDLEDVFARYTPPSIRYAATNEQSQPVTPDLNPLQLPLCSGSENDVSAENESNVADVADLKGGKEGVAAPEAEKEAPEWKSVGK